jgi:hypothetical protein
MIGPQERAAWTGKTIDFRTDGLHTLSAAEVEEIDAALFCLREQGELDFPAITPETFPLPTLGTFLRGMRDELRFGRGFVLLRGIPRERYSTDDMARIYFGLGCHIGAPLPQSWQGELLGHVIDVSDIEPGARGYHRRRTALHTDSCDVVADVPAIREVRRRQPIYGSIAVHRWLERERPDLLQALSAGSSSAAAVDAEHGSGVAGPHRCSLPGEEISVFYPATTPIVPSPPAARPSLTPISARLWTRFSVSPRRPTPISTCASAGATSSSSTIACCMVRTTRTTGMAGAAACCASGSESRAGRRARVRQCIPAKTTRWLRQRTPFMEVPSRYLAESPRDRPNWRTDPALTRNNVVAIVLLII